MRKLWTLLALAVCGCSSSKLIDTWADPEFTGPALRKVFVVSDRKDAARRALWEDSFVGQLISRGTQATACYTVFPDSLPDARELRAALQNGGYDAVLFVSKPVTTSRERVVPGTTTSVPQTVAGPFFRGYGTVYEQVYAPGYTETEKTLRIHADVYRTGEHEALIWSTTSETIDPSSSVQVSREVTELIVPALVRAKIFP